jgi:hypothetical protein
MEPVFRLAVSECSLRVLLSSTMSCTVTQFLGCADGGDDARIQLALGADVGGVPGVRVPGRDRGMDGGRRRFVGRRRGCRVSATHTNSSTTLII